MRRSKIVWRWAVVVAALLASQSGAAAADGIPKHEAPIPAGALALMAAKRTGPASPILVRTFKKEAELEVWKRTSDGKFVLLKTYPVCRWSGQLGPKSKQGDRQTPEGFYAVGPAQMNPNSAHHLSFNIGFPNAYDRAHGASGTYLMVHGRCSSAGCFAMTDKAVEEIYAIAREAFRGGQQSFQFQSYPFRMTAENIARHRSDPNIAFWRQLKEGSDRFEATGEEVAVTVSAGRYAFPPFKDPAKEARAEARRAEEEARIATLVAEGAAAVRITYADGGQHASFRALARKGVSLGEVSRPEALALAGREIVVVPARRKPAKTELAAGPTSPLAGLGGTPPTFGVPGLGPLADAEPLLSAQPSPAAAQSGQPLGAWPLLAGSAGILPAEVTTASPEKLAAHQ